MQGHSLQAALRSNELCSLHIKGTLNTLIQRLG